MAAHAARGGLTVTRPNILVVMADQMTPFMTGPYGHPVAQTPAMDALAAKGTVFENAYCNAPLCCPSRASMMTGRLGSAIGAYDNASELPAQIPTFVHHLRRAGYETTLSGKMHFVGPDQLHGFEHRLTTDIYPAGIQWIPDWSKGNVPNPSNRGPMANLLDQSGVCDWSLQLDYDEETHFRAMEYLRRVGREAKGGSREQPWFLCVSYTHPHDPFCTTRAYWDRYEGADIPMPEAPPADHQPHEVDDWVDTFHGLKQRPMTEEDIRTARRGYLGSISYIDDKLKDMVDALDTFGMRENTIVIFVSDHGEMIGEHGHVFKRTHYEWSVRVPLIVSVPGQEAKGERITKVVSLVDLFPTLLDMAGLEIPAGLDGQSVLPLVHGQQEDWPDEMICENLGEGTWRPVRQIRRGRYMYVYVHGAPPLLYDLEADPGQWVNLAGRPELAEVEAELHHQVMDGRDPVETERRILQDQQSRFFLREALSQGRPAPWDFQPEFPASKQYVRK